jgi:hypothetical protein
MAKPLHFEAGGLAQDILTRRQSNEYVPGRILASRLQGILPDVFGAIVFFY